MFSRNSLLGVFAAAVLLSGETRADDMSDISDWCTKVTAPSNVVICSDPELRRSAVVRNKIFEDARRTSVARRGAGHRDAEAQRAIERAAEETRRQIQVEAAREKLVARLKVLGFQLITPVDLNLDWKNYMASKTKIAVDGTYVEA